MTIKLSLSHKVGSGPLYVDDVFSAYTYTATGATLSINNGIDLAGKGGMVWLKNRSNARDNALGDTSQGSTKAMSSNTTSANSYFGTQNFDSFNSNGFTLNASFGAANNLSETIASWTFRKAAKFFDVVTWSGTGGSRTLTHSLGQAPGMIIVKNITAGENWYVYHRSLGETQAINLNQTDPVYTSSTRWNDTAPTSTQFTVGSASNNALYSYVAYIFAHDTAADGLIQCGSFTTDGSGNATVTLGWEPQFLLTKSSSPGASQWEMSDQARGWWNSTSGATVNMLNANLTNAESTNIIRTKPTATGFTGSSFTASTTYIYLAIRRPNKPPTTGTQVYNAISRTGTSATTTVTGVGFPPDAVFAYKQTGGIERGTVDRLRGRAKYLSTAETSAEYTTTGTSNDVVSFNMDGLTLGPTDASGINAGPDTHINYFFRRAPQVFDEVCYTGTGSATTVTHNLGVAPELWIVKDRSNANDWAVGTTQIPATDYLALNTTAGKATNGSYWNSTYPTSTVFSLGSTAVVNSTHTYVAYLFATKAGISKVFSYTGNGSSQTINCGFSAGARFILIKRTDSTGDWYVWDTVRGVVAGNDPHLSLNTTVAEVTTNDSIDPDNSGFIVNQLAATNINVTSATYIGLAFA